MKIQPQELRLGNWVESNGKPRKIAELAPKICWIKYEAGISCITYDSIQPIPLTEEVLRKAGFEKSHIGCYYIELDRFTKLYCNIEYKQTEISVSCHAYKNIPCNYLHQLQNLFAALTGQELRVEW